MPSPYTEATLIEQPAIELLAELGWETVDARGEWASGASSLGRATKSEVVLAGRLRAALARLNPDAPAAALDAAVAELARERAALAPAHANQEVYRLLKQGVKTRVRDRRGDERDVTVRVVDWETPSNNDFLLAAQLTITGDLYTRRPDLVGFVNGLPLLLAEFKATHVPVRDAYDDNLRDYKATIPQLFPYNALIVLSNGSDSRLGSLTAAWEHFAEWKKVDDENAPGVVSLETLLRGTCAPARLLDLVENFTLFSDIGGGLAKVLGKNHQLLGVNNAFAALRRLEENRGRLGVFWHTQGSGKSYSMVFFSQKALRKLPGNWTFVIVTDRQELDEQIYKTFAAAGAVTEPDEAVHAASGEHLRQLLREDHRHVFTLIQKFHAPSGEAFPLLSERSDIIVITDEAHRGQYDLFALNMRRALPNAAFIGFTGTPLLVGEEKTRAVFGDYVSVYNFRQSIEDGATTPLYYENRIPELQLTNDQLNEELAELLEGADLDEEQERKLEREFWREYHLITRDDRLETIAGDIVRHFSGRGFPGKAMVVSIDKATAVRMHHKVRAHWTAELDRRRAALPRLSGAAREAAAATLRCMETTHMAVVVSPAQNEAADFAAKGLDITSHRRRMVTEDLAKKFKDADDSFRLVFVCAMWMTGFDVPSLSTIYLDKPLRNHTLMQTIARANRVYAGKLNGLIVDYVGVFRDLQQALAIYGSGADGSAAPGELPVRDKAELVARLRAALDAARAFLAGLGVDVEAALAARGFAKVAALDAAVEAVLVNDDTKKDAIAHANAVAALFKAILPDAAAEEFRPRVALLAELVKKLRALAAPVDIDGVMLEVEQLLDASIAAEGYVIHEGGEAYDVRRLIDLSQIDFEALRALFEQGQRRAAAERLKGDIGRALERLVERNTTRVDYLRQFQELIDAYNAGALNVEVFFARLQAFAQTLSAEERRAIAEQLSEEELAVFDLLTRPDPGLNAQETAEVKRVARELLATLKREKLTLDWRKRQQSRADVMVAIEQVLDSGLPHIYTKADYDGRCTAIFQHVYDRYAGAGHSVYDAA